MVSLSLIKQTLKHIEASITVNCDNDMHWNNFGNNGIQKEPRIILK